MAERRLDDPAIADGCASHVEAGQADTHAETLRSHAVSSGSASTAQRRMDTA